MATQRQNPRQNNQPPPQNHAPPQEQPQEKRGPVQRFRYPCRGGTVSVSVWDKAVKSDNGEEWTAYSVTLQRSYNDGQKWAWTPSIRDEDIPAAVIALQDAYRWIGQQKLPSDTPF